jgi:hypothetical protein
MKTESKRLTIREVAVLEVMKHFLKSNKTECMYEGALNQELDHNLFPIELLPTTIASLVRRGIIVKTKDVYDGSSVLTLVK